MQIMRHVLVLLIKLWKFMNEQFKLLPIQLTFGCITAHLPQARSEIQTLSEGNNCSFMHYCCWSWLGSL